MIPSDLRIPLTFQRRQFPITLYFGMTVNKSQEQSLSYVKLFLLKLIFIHRQQLYVAVQESNLKAVKRF